MLLNAQTSDTPGKAFGFEKTAEAFQLLSSTLYSNKPRAIIRELSCNAYDAQVLSGTQDKPFDIKLPNSLDPQFSVRDYGPGLSHKDVLELYTTYFKSTKQTSNDFIGGFGVGSKSPFAYTDSFTVESWHEGTKRIYTAFLNDSGIPEMALMLEDSSIEPSGLSVSFPVRPADFSSFEREANSVLSTFPITPNVTGIAYAPPERGALLVKGSNYSLRAESMHAQQGAYVQMGAVEYPISKFAEHIGHNNAHLTHVLRSNISIQVPLGALSVAVSREDLSYDEKTVAALTKLLTDVYHEQITSFKDFPSWSEKTQRHMRNQFSQVKIAELKKRFPGNEFTDFQKYTANRDLTGSSHVASLYMASAADLTDLKQIARTKFGEKQADDTKIVSYSVKYPGSALVLNKLHQMQAKSLPVSVDDTVFVAINESCASNADKVLALTTALKAKGLKDRVGLFIPSKGASANMSGFLDEIKKTYGIGILDITDDYLAASESLRDQTTGPTANPQSADKQTGAVKKTTLALVKELFAESTTAASTAIAKRVFNAQWCMPIDIHHASFNSQTEWVKALKKGASPQFMKKKMWRALPSMPDYLADKRVHYMEYDATENTIDGLKPERIVDLLRLGSSVLNLKPKYFVLVPKGSVLRDQPKWRSYVTEWVAAFNAVGYGARHDQLVHNYSTLNAELACGPDNSAWSGTMLAQLLAELPRVSEQQDPPSEVLRLHQVFANKGIAAQYSQPTKLSMDDFPDIQSQIQSNYPALGPLLPSICRSLSDNHCSTPAVVKGLLEYISGQEELLQTNSTHQLT